MEVVSTQQVHAIGTMPLMVCLFSVKCSFCLRLLKKIILTFHTGSCTVRWENKTMYCVVSVFGLSLWASDINEPNYRFVISILACKSVLGFTQYCFQLMMCTFNPQTWDNQNLNCWIFIQFFSICLKCLRDIYLVGLSYSTFAAPLWKWNKLMIS